MPDIPSIIRGAQDDYRNLYYSEPMAALKVPVTLQSGYGLLKIGTALAKNLSALTTGGKDQLLPYNPTTFTGAEKHPGRAYLVADSGAAATILYVSQDDSWKFKVGDDVIINDDTTAAENLGAVTAIDRTTDLSRAAITITTQTGGTSFTVARKANIFVEAGTSGNNYSDGVGILEKSVDTGTGENAKGAVATLILGNCVLYEGLLTNVDAAFRTDVSAAQFGQYMYIR
ncbi:MAG: hypothetical protein ACYSOO_05545 [Planctomycetota bacterium]|jgi:hypothetical protein